MKAEHHVWTKSEKMQEENDNLRILLNEVFTESMDHGNVHISYICGKMDYWCDICRAQAESRDGVNHANDCIVSRVRDEMMEP